MFKRTAASPIRVYKMLQMIARHYRQSVLGRMILGPVLRIILGPVLSSSLQGIVRVKEGQVFVRTLECTTAKHYCLWQTFPDSFGKNESKPTQLQRMNDPMGSTNAR